MQTYDVTLIGFDGGTDATDHLVKWVRAPCEATLQLWLREIGLWDHMTMISGKPNVRWVEVHGETYDDGVNVFLLDEPTGDHVEVEYRPGSWQQTKEPFDPQEWIDESRAVCQAL